VAVDWSAVDYEEFGGHVRSLRESCGLERQELAEKTRVSVATIRHIERAYGDREFSRKTLQALSTVLVKDDPDYLYNWLPQRGRKTQRAIEPSKGADKSGAPSAGNPAAEIPPRFGVTDKITSSSEPVEALLTDIAHLMAAQEGFAREQQSLAAQVRYVVSAVDDIKAHLRVPSNGSPAPGPAEDR
jgi:transcriptional regulator with XRE-family HTH domain